MRLFADYRWSFEENFFRKDRLFSKFEINVSFLEIRHMVYLNKLSFASWDILSSYNILFQGFGQSCYVGFWCASKKRKMCEYINIFIS